MVIVMGMSAVKPLTFLDQRVVHTIDYLVPLTCPLSDSGSEPDSPWRRCTLSECSCFFLSASTSGVWFSRSLLGMTPANGLWR